MANENLGITREVTPSDTTTIRFNFMFIGTAGTVSWETEGGDTHVINSPIVGTFFPVGNGVKVLSTGTTATGIQVF